MSKSFFTIDEKIFRQRLIDKLNGELQEFAEPILQENLKRIEVKMREKLGSMLIGLIEENMIIDTMGKDLRITLIQGVKK